jgi:SAM-dependent methyltransferase
MLAVARSRVADGEFHHADLHEVPLPDESADIVVCALTLSHVRDLDAAMAALARLLKPGGSLVISDARPLVNDIGLPFVREQPDGSLGYARNEMRLTSDYLNSGLRLGLSVRRCEEPRRSSPFVDETGTPPEDAAPLDRYIAGDVPDIWSLHPWCPAAANAAYDGTRSLIVWHFQRDL